MCPSQARVCMWERTWSFCFSVLFRIARKWKRPECPSADEWIVEMWRIDIMEFSSAVETNETAGKWMDLGCGIFLKLYLLLVCTRGARVLWRACGCRVYSPKVYTASTWPAHHLAGPWIEALLRNNSCSAICLFNMYTTVLWNRFTVVWLSPPRIIEHFHCLQEARHVSAIRPLSQP